MDYYIIVNGEKEGPIDVLSFIKKVKNGGINAATQVSTTLEGPFRPAGEIEELKSIIKEDNLTGPQTGREEVNLNISMLINEATDTWLRKITEYTIAFAAIVVVTIIFYKILNQIQFFADYVYINNYICSVVTFTLLGVFFYYVLMTKRNQDPDIKELLVIVKSSLAKLVIFSAALSLLTLPLGLNVALTTIMFGVIAVVLSLTIFVPFAIIDHDMSLKRGVMVSFESFKTMKKSALVTVFGIIIVNIAAGILPLLIHSQILLLGLVVIVPISISVLAQIYDRILA